jgi:hypothetical protein
MYPKELFYGKNIQNVAPKNREFWLPTKVNGHSMVIQMSVFCV